MSWTDLFESGGEAKTAKTKISRSFVRDRFRYANDPDGKTQLGPIFAHEQLRGNWDAAVEEFTDVKADAIFYISEKMKEFNGYSIHCKASRIKGSEIKMDTEYCILNDHQTSKEDVVRAKNIFIAAGLNPKHVRNIVLLATLVTNATPVDKEDRKAALLKAVNLLRGRDEAAVAPQNNNPTTVAMHSVKAPSGHRRFRDKLYGICKDKEGNHHAAHAWFGRGLECKDAAHVGLLLSHPSIIGGLEAACTSLGNTLNPKTLGWLYACMVQAGVEVPVFLENTVGENSPGDTLLFHNEVHSLFCDSLTVSKAKNLELALNEAGFDVPEFQRLWRYAMKVDREELGTNDHNSCVEDFKSVVDDYRGVPAAAVVAGAGPPDAGGPPGGPPVPPAVLGMGGATNGAGTGTGTGATIGASTVAAAAPSPSVVAIPTPSPGGQRKRKSSSKKTQNV